MTAPTDKMRERAREIAHEATGCAQSYVHSVKCALATSDIAQALADERAAALEEAAKEVSQLYRRIAMAAAARCRALLTTGEGK